MHVLRWRRGLFADEVLFDDRRVATAKGMFNRENIFGLGLNADAGGEIRLLFTVDTEEDWTDWSGDMKPGGVRLETADDTLIAYGNLGPDRMEPFRQLYDRAIQSLGLS